MARTSAIRPTMETMSWRSEWKRCPVGNPLLRQYLPKGTDLSRHSQAQLDAIAAKLNSRPRKILDYQTPAATLQQAVALTG